MEENNKQQQNSNEDSKMSPDHDNDNKNMKWQQQRMATTKIVQSARFVKNVWDVGVS